MSATEADAIAELARQAQRLPEILQSASGREFLILPDGSFKDISEPNEIAPILPGNIRQALVLQTVDSLVDYVNLYKTDDTVLFADIASNTIVAVIDYHGAGQAGHVAHKATMTLPHSVEWDTWKAIDKKLVGQLEFARFLEENAGDIVAPSGGALLDACRDLQAHRKVNFIKAVRTSSDNENFEYTDETEARTRGGVEVPSKFQLQLPVYFGGEATDLFAFLRWKLVEGEGLMLGVQLHRAEHGRQAVFKQIVLDAAERTDRQAVFGRLSS